jgi:DNA-binding XRE family transcriptional regulator
MDAVDLAELLRLRAEHESLGIRASSAGSTPIAVTRAPNIHTCWYRLHDAAFVVVFVDGTRAELPRDRVDPVGGGNVVACSPDEFGRGVEVALDDGTTTSFSADYVLYVTDAAFRARVDAATPPPRSASGTFGQRVREAREALGLSLAELGRRVGMAAPNVHRIERDAHAPSARTLLLMAEALQQPIVLLLTGESPSSVATRPRDRTR